MRYKADQKEETRRRILEAAGRSFKKKGYNGVGVDGLAKAAGVTSGAFYVHFKSKAAAFKASVLVGLEEVQDAITSLKEQYGSNWWATFASFYMGQKRTCELDDSCALQSLSIEVGRFDEEAKVLYEEELLKIIDLATSEDSSKEEREKTWANIAMLVGGVTLARAVHDKEVADEIAKAVEDTVKSRMSQYT